MLDSVNLEKMGIPTVTVVTEPFVAAADTVARSLGMADLPRVTIPHDYLGEDTSAITEKLQPVIDTIFDRLFLR